MLTEAEKKKLETYFGFARKEHGLAVGMELDERLAKRQIALLILTPQGSRRAHDDLRESCKDSKNIVILDYTGDYPIHISCGYTSMKAVGIRDEHLAKPIYELLKKDMGETGSVSKEDTQ
jgi:hypothetical protein